MLRFYVTKGLPLTDGESRITVLDDETGLWVRFITYMAIHKSSLTEFKANILADGIDSYETYSINPELENYTEF
ncbi:hypothetical protein [Pectobacterium phage Wc4-1]|uniref:Uncharacterized protein n=1 Tax=Pectobacterium phage Wc4 TaxID=2652428 RepID=A0A5P8D797_9CAUD|nr:hypothetical protein [Pectobacterium phage Wc4]QFP94055.1 hypothetical protein [Pectobacterium phage Wc4-1]